MVLLLWRWFYMTFYAGLDVHKEHINAAVVNSRGRIVKEAKFMNSPQALDSFLSGLSSDTEFALEACGFYEPEHFPGYQYPRIQILTIKELLEGKEAQYPRMAPAATFKRAQRHRRNAEGQQQLI